MDTFDMAKKLCEESQYEEAIDAFNKVPISHKLFKSARSNIISLNILLCMQQKREIWETTTNTPSKEIADGCTSFTY